MVYECIWVFLDLVASLWTSIGAAKRGITSRFADPEEYLPDDDYDYAEELGDDLLPGATSHPPS